MEYVDYKDFNPAEKQYFPISELNQKTGWSGIGFMKVIILLAFATFSFNNEATSLVSQDGVEKKINERVNINDIVYSGDNFESKISPILVLSNRLQKEFGFKKSQWASVLNVERKTLYNWEEKPDSSPHSKVMNNLLVLEKFNREIDEGHAPFISKFAFGKTRKSEITKAFTTQPLTIDVMLSAYEMYYSEIDGFYKRQLLS